LIIGLSGYARSGKDTVANLLVLNYSFKRLAFADAIKDAVLLLNPILDNGRRVNDVVNDYGWEIAKANTEVRRLLQVMGTEVGRKLIDEYVWIDKVFNQIATGERFVITDVRFPNEANMIQAVEGKVWRINRHNHSAVNTHISERAMDNFMVDHVVYNDGSLDELSNEVFMLMNSVLNK